MAAMQPRVMSPPPKGTLTIATRQQDASEHAAHSARRNRVLSPPRALGQMTVANAFDDLHRSRPLLPTAAPGVMQLAQPSPPRFVSVDVPVHAHTARSSSPSRPLDALSIPRPMDVRATGVAKQYQYGPPSLEQLRREIQRESDQRAAMQDAQDVQSFNLHMVTKKVDAQCSAIEAAFKEAMQSLTLRMEEESERQRLQVQVSVLDVVRKDLHRAALEMKATTRDLEGRLSKVVSEESLELIREELSALDKKLHVHVLPAVDMARADLRQEAEVRESGLRDLECILRDVIRNEVAQTGSSYGSSPAPSSEMQALRESVSKLSREVSRLQATASGTSKELSSSHATMEARPSNGGLADLRNHLEELDQSVDSNGLALGSQSLEALIHKLSENIAAEVVERQAAFSSVRSEVEATRGQILEQVEDSVKDMQAQLEDRIQDLTQRASVVNITSQNIGNDSQEKGSAVLGATSLEMRKLREHWEVERAATVNDVISAKERAQKALSHSEELAATLEARYGEQQDWAREVADLQGRFEKLNEAVSAMQAAELRTSPSVPSDLKAAVDKLSDDLASLDEKVNGNVLPAVEALSVDVRHEAEVRETSMKDLECILRHLSLRITGYDPNKIVNSP